LNSGGGLAFSQREDVVTRRIAASLIAALMLAACAHEGGSVAPGMTWSLTSTKEEGSKLGYGAPDTDNLVLMLECQPKSGQVQVWLMGPAAEKPIPLVLSSGGRTARVDGRSDGDGYEAIHATVPAHTGCTQKIAAAIHPPGHFSFFRMLQMSAAFPACSARLSNLNPQGLFPQICQPAHSTVEVTGR